MATPHIGAEKGDIAKVVLMPGDPLRAKHIAENYLSDVRLFNSVRNMLGYTGTFEDVPVSVMGSGMGVPSMAIYSYELFNVFDVDTIIRIGTTGGLAPQVRLRDLVFAQGACSNTYYPANFGLHGTFAPICDFGLLRKAVEIAEALGVPYHVGNVVTTDVYYSDVAGNEAWAAMGVLGAEMEAVGLYLNAAKAHKKALGMMSVSDLPLTGEELDAEQRQTSFTQMMEVALALAVSEYDEKSV